MKNSIELTFLDVYYQFFKVNIQIGYDIIYGYEDNNGWVVCDKVFEPLYLPQTVNILFQFLCFINGNLIVPKLFDYICVSKGCVETINEFNKQSLPITISSELFQNLINFKKLSPETQVELFKNLYSTEAFQNLVKEKYGSFEGYLELISFFEKNRLYEEQNKAITDMIVAVMENYIKFHSIK